MADSIVTPQPLQALPTSLGNPVPFGANEMRLTARQWTAAISILLLIVFIAPRVWKRIEQFRTTPDYRIPYRLSKDYWLFERGVETLAEPGKIVVLGDSVIWGEYVKPDGTLPHFLSQQTGTAGKFVNAGVNGLFPLALEGLVRYHADPVQRRKVLLHANVLWMSSPKADLQTEKEERFNHSRLVPQFFPRIPCYKADANERLGASIERRVNFLAWVSHLENCYFEGKSILSWTLEEDGGSPPLRPNAYKNPLTQITLQVPAEPAEDPDRNPHSPRHKSWSATGGRPVNFDWVNPETSLQWGAFRRLVKLLQKRDNDVLVVLGPFNEHMIAAQSKPGFNHLRDRIAAWLKENQVPHVVPEVLPSALYADASHPLTDGYALLAKRLYNDPLVQEWLKK